MAAKLLLAEDSLTIQKVFKLALKHTGISLTVVDNGIDAIRLAKEISPDLVVADVSLPGKEGFEVAAELGADETSHAVPVLILAGTLAPFNEERFRSCGAAGVLFKPFESQELIDKVEALLRRKEEPAQTTEDKEEAPSSAEEPWDFSDVLSEMEEEAGTSSETPAAGEEDLPGMAAASAGGVESTLSLGDFDVSLDDIEGGAEKEAIPMEPDAPGQEESVGLDPTEEEEEQIFLMEEHVGDAGFDDSPPAVTDLTPAIEEVEDREEIDLLEGTEVPEGDVSVLAPPEETMVPPPSVALGTVSVGAAPEDVPTPPAAEPLPGEAEFRELFAARAQEIFEKVAEETVEKVMWEMMENLTKEFTERIRESVEAVVWEVVPATTEALIREEIARIREQAEKESS
ncbi:MAG: response regulator [Candidatus Deferrimicrobiaceae bacterium]